MCYQLQRLLYTYHQCSHLELQDQRSNMQLNMLQDQCVKRSNSWKVSKHIRNLNYIPIYIPFLIYSMHSHYQGVVAPGMQHVVMHKCTVFIWVQYSIFNNSSHTVTESAHSLNYKKCSYGKNHIHNAVPSRVSMYTS